MRHEEDAEGQVGDQNGREQDQSAIVKGGSLQLDRVLHDGPRKKQSQGGAAFAMGNSDGKSGG